MHLVCNQKGEAIQENRVIADIINCVMKKLRVRKRRLRKQIVSASTSRITLATELLTKTRKTWKKLILITFKAKYMLQLID